jgi:hypothetical protein
MTRNLAANADINLLINLKFLKELWKTAATSDLSNDENRLSQNVLETELWLFMMVTQTKH